MKILVISLLMLIPNICYASEDFWGNELKDGDEKPYFKKYIFNCKDLRTAIQRNLLEQIGNINFKKYIVPTDTIFEKSKATKKLIQAMDKIKPETQNVLSEIANDFIKGE